MNRFFTKLFLALSATPTEILEERYCEECRWYRDAGTSCTNYEIRVKFAQMYPENDKRTAQPVVSKGSALKCIYCRKKSNLCGPSGRYFERKVNEVN